MRSLRQHQAAHRATGDDTIPQRLIDCAQVLVADGRGLLAIEENTATSRRRFAKLGIPQTADARHGDRDMIATTPRLGESFSGAALYDETIRQQTLAGVPFSQAPQQAGIVSGIKGDAGAKVLTSVTRRNGWQCSFGASVTKRQRRTTE